jgi:hypothetical protein
MDAFVAVLGFAYWTPEDRVVPSQVIVSGSSATLAL